MQRSGIAVAWLLGIAVSLFGCGGGGGGNSAPTPTPIGTVVNLQEVKSLNEASAAPGAGMAFVMTGSVTDGSHGNSLAAVYATSIGNPATRDGQTVRTKTHTLSITNLDAGLSVSVKSTSYILPSGYVQQLAINDGTTATPAQEVLLPVTAKVGDSGSYLTWHFSDGSTESKTWRIEPGYNGSAAVVFSYSSQDRNEVPTSTQEERFTINSDGTIADLVFVIKYLDDGTTVSLSGKRTLLPTSLAISPNNLTVAKGIAPRFTATGDFPDGTTRDVTSLVLWNSSDSSLASVSNDPRTSGLVTTLSTGSPTITASLGAMQCSSSLTITPAELAFLTVSPANPLFKGTFQQFSASGTYTDGTVRDVTSIVTWSTSDPVVASISNAGTSKGLAVALNSGTSAITATAGNLSHATNLTVSPWALGNTGTTVDLHGVAWSGTSMVAVGDISTILSSPDGTTWTSRNPGIATYFYDTAWLGDHFAAVGAGNELVTSPDGATWTSYSYPDHTPLCGIARSGSQFVAVGFKIFSSPDEVTWTPREGYLTNSVCGIVWSGQKFVTVGYGGKILTSSDGLTWTTRVSGTTNSLEGVAWSGLRFVAVGARGAVLTSPDGITWSSVSSGISDMLYGVVWTGRQFVAVGSNGSDYYGYGQVYTSPDGITWTKIFGNGEPRCKALLSVAVMGNRIVAAGIKGTVLISPPL